MSGGAPHLDAQRGHERTSQRRVEHRREQRAVGDPALVDVLLGDGAEDGRLAAAEFAVADAQSLADARFLRSLGEVELVSHVRAMGSLHRVIALNAHQMTMAERADADLPPALEFARAGALRLARVNPRVWIASGIAILLVLGGWGGYVLISGMLAPDEAPPPDLRGTFMVRFEEIEQSRRIILQAAEGLPGGAWMVEDHLVAL